MGRKACIRGVRITQGTIVRLIASDSSPEDNLESYPYLEAVDIPAELSYAGGRSEEIDVPLDCHSRKG